MKVDESKLRDTVREIIRESLLGLSFDNFAKNGHFREESKSKNPVIQTAWRNGWELEKDDANEAAIDGVYQARIMDGAFNNWEPDEYPYDSKHPKVSWPMLIAILNKQFRAAGYFVKGSNFRRTCRDLWDRETDEGVKGLAGTITVVKNR